MTTACINDDCSLSSLPLEEDIASMYRYEILVSMYRRLDSSFVHSQIFHLQIWLSVKGFRVGLGFRV